MGLQSVVVKMRSRYVSRGVQRIHAWQLTPPYCGQSAVSEARVKDPRCCLSCLSLLPANAPVPSNTDKYCPNPELSLYTETAEGMWL